MITPAQFYGALAVFMVGALLMVGGAVFGREQDMGRGSTSEERDVRSSVQLYQEAPWGAPEEKRPWYVRLWRWVKGLFGR